MTEGGSTQSQQFSWFFGDDRGSSGRVVHQGELSKGFSRDIGLHVDVLVVDEFVAVVFSRLNNKKLVSDLSLFDDEFELVSFSWSYGAKDDLLVLTVQIFEEDGVSN